MNWISSLGKYVATTARPDPALEYTIYKYCHKNQHKTLIIFNVFFFLENFFFFIFRIFWELFKCILAFWVCFVL